jgi:phage terminase large subunit-like protein
VLDVVRARVGPKEVRRLIRQTAEGDGRGVPVRIEREGGASGKIAADAS